MTGWTGKGIDVTQLKSRVEQVRRDYIAARPPAKGEDFHVALLDLARQNVLHSAFFRRERWRHRNEPPE